MFNVIKSHAKALVGGTALALFAGLALVSPFAAVHAQTIPTWSTTSTNAIVSATADQFQASAVYTLQTIAPYAIAVGAVVLVVGFLIGLLWRARRQAGA